MNEEFEKLMQTVKQLLSLREDEKAYGELQRAAIDEERLTSEEKSRFYQIHARCLYRLGRYAESHERLEMALVISRQLNNDSLYASQKQLLGGIYLAESRMTDAIESFEEAYAFQKKAEENSSLYGSLSNLAMTHFQKGNLVQAHDLLLRSLKCALRYNNLAEKLDCQFNLARVLMFLGRFRESSAELNKIQAIAENSRDQNELKELGGISEAFLLNHESARSKLHDALSYYQSEGIRRSQVVCLEYLGLNESYAGNYDKALEYFQQALAIPEVTISALAQTYRMMTEAYLAKGDVSKATEFAAKAEEAIDKAGEKIELGALYRAQAQLFEAKYDYEKSRASYEKSIELLRNLNANYELAMSYLAVGRSGFYGVEERVKHLYSAMGLFSGMGVPKRVEQVERLISGYLMNFDALGRLFATKDGAVEMLTALTKGPKKVETLLAKVAPRGPQWELVSELSRQNLVEVAGEKMFITPKGQDIVTRLEKAY